jgi:hypothetical protein
VNRVLIGLFCASTSLYGSAILVSNPAGVFSNDFVTWTQPGTGVSQTFYDVSTDYEFVSGHLSNGSGQVVSACSTCAFKASGGVASNDSLLLTSDGTSDSAPLTFTLNSPVYGAGAYIEAATPSNTEASTTFSVRIQAFYGVSSVLTSTSVVTSDAFGDAVFVGITDPTQEITKIIFSLTDANGNPVTGNFAIDKLYIQNSLVAPVQVVQIPQVLAPGVPEPSMMLLVGPALLALMFGVRRRVALG